jgi:cytochrome c biogenesis protein CcmG/thiol:disulfide interchange protein DsbE
MGVFPRRLFALVAPVLVACALAACASDGEGDFPEAPTLTSATENKEAARRLAKAPAALRANAEGADRLVGVGEAALHARLDELHGHPVVVNVWASWCGPCRAEFPYFADAVVEHGDEVAFLGIDYQDDRGSAVRLLREIPPGFASVVDQGGDATRSLGGGRVMPTTFFLGRDGDVTYTKLGGYRDAAALRADIRRYALGAR